MNYSIEDIEKLLTAESVDFTEEEAKYAIDKLKKEQ